MEINISTELKVGRMEKKTHAARNNSLNQHSNMLTLNLLNHNIKFLGGIYGLHTFFILFFSSSHIFFQTNSINSLSEIGVVGCSVVFLSSLLFTCFRFVSFVNFLFRPLVFLIPGFQSYWMFIRK